MDDELGVQGLSEEEYRCPMPWDNENSTLCTFFKEAIAMAAKNWNRFAVAISAWYLQSAEAD